MIYFILKDSILEDLLSKLGNKSMGRFCFQEEPTS